MKNENKLIIISVLAFIVVFIGLALARDSYHYNIFYLAQQAEKKDSITHQINTPLR